MQVLPSIGILIAGAAAGPAAFPWPTIDGNFFLGIAGLITALGAIGAFGRRGLAKQRAGVPVREADIDSDLHADRARLLKEIADARTRLDEADVRRREDLAQAERVRSEQVRILNDKVDELVRRLNDAIDVTIRNRRIFIEQYGTEALAGFVEQPAVEDTWRPSELKRLREAGRTPES